MYDIGIYYEANGHGTVLFSKIAQQSEHLNLLSKLVSQVVGDAIGNMLMVEFILSACDYSLNDWINMYDDMIVLQDKLYINRCMFETIDYGRKLVKPLGLQDTIDNILSTYSYGNPRAFVRPSGTENLVRLYVEGEDEDCVVAINEKIKNAIVATCYSLTCE
jgi:phosphoacetylglucosamine mutase